MADHCCPWWMNYIIGNPLRRWLEPPEKLFGDMVEPGMSVLDAGCGMGVFTLPLARMAGPGGSVVAVDFDPRNLSVLERKARRRGFGDRITTVACDMGELPLDGRRFDFVLAANSVHEVPEYHRFFNCLAGLLNPAARFLIIEPSFHMGREEFEKELELAQQAGMELEERRAASRSRYAAVLRMK
jgi:ubiquinone/menaquinone biosynthesis C-methylase UbiE